MSSRTVYSPIVRAVYPSGGGYLAHWRGADSDDTYVASNCTASGSCRIAPTGALLPTSASNSNDGRALQALDSSQHMLDVFGGIMDTNIIYMKIPYDDPDCPNGCALDRYNFGIELAAARDGDLPPHELGHLLQMQEFGKQIPQSVLRSDCSLGGSWWDVGSDEYDSCATTEGFASYVAAVSLWDPGVAAATPIYSGISVELANVQSSNCSANRGKAGQVMKAFWDLDDVNDDVSVLPGSGNDYSNRSTTSIVEAWDTFTNGTGDHDDFEAGIHGVNMKDYQYWANSPDQNLTHNCLQFQEDG